MSTPIWNNSEIDGENSLGICYYVDMCKQSEPEIRVDRLLRLMDERGWKQAHLARASGVSKSTISLLTDAKRPNTSAINMAKIAMALECSLLYLLGMSDAREPLDDAFLEGLESEVYRELLNNFKRLNQTRQSEVLGILEVLVKNQEELRQDPDVQRNLQLLESIHGADLRDWAEKML